MSDAHLDPARRHDTVLLFDVTDGNPNGDPDAGNQPRTDDETGQGLVTDVALKRKIRDVDRPARAGDDPVRHLRRSRARPQHPPRVVRRPRTHDPGQEQAEPSSAGCATATSTSACSARCSAPARRKRAAGQIRGPLQLTFARSVDPVLPIDHAITRVTQTRQEDIDKGETHRDGLQMDRALRPVPGPRLLLRPPRRQDRRHHRRPGRPVDRRLTVMFDHDRSATRGEMKLCGLYVFSHPDAFGAAPAPASPSRIHTQAHDDRQGRPAHHTDYTCIIDDDRPARRHRRSDQAGRPLAVTAHDPDWTRHSGPPGRSRCPRWNTSPTADGRPR